MKRAAIYARVSSERQAGEDRVSIEAQLADCEAHCRQRGYIVVERYVDKEKYRVKGKLVQPSGQRKDRPRYMAMLRAAAGGQFDVIIAWKEDRLYRGMYAAMPLSELLDELGRRLEVELVKDTFDRKMLGIKAALGKIESDNIRERMIMGRRARLERGEVPGGDQVRYGYKKVDKRLQINEAEVEIVHQIVGWYITGQTVLQIRRRLNAAGVPTRKGKGWAKASIEHILTNECYVTGKVATTLDGETFYIDCPVILSTETWKKMQQVRQGNRFVARNQKEDFLCAGLVYCACGWKCQTRAKQGNRHKGYEKVQGVYVCQRRSHMPENLPPDCSTNTGSRKVDNYVWDFVRRICRDSAVIGQAIDQKLATLELEQVNLEAEINALERKLDSLTMERQRVITMARKDLITEADLELQLTGIKFQEMGTHKELDEKRRLAEVKEQSQLLSDWVARYLSGLRDGIEALDVNPDNLAAEERQALAEELDASQYAGRFPGDEMAQLRWAIFEEKRRTVRMLVKRVIVSRVEGPGKRKVTVVLSLELPAEESLTFGYQSPYAYDSLYEKKRVSVTVSSDDVDSEDKK